MGLGNFLKKIAPIAIGGLIGGPLLGGLGSAFGGATGGGLGGLIGGFQSSGLGTALKFGTQAFGLFSQFQAGQEQIRQAELSNSIQAANTLEAIKFFPIKERALKKEEESLASGRVLEKERLTESRARISRSQSFGAAAIGREVLALEERVRQLGEQEQRALGTVSAQAAASGIRVSSQSAQLRRQDVSEEAGFAQAQLQLQREEIEQQQLELQQQFEDAIFDADFQEKIQLRNEQIGRDRIAFEREVNIERERTARDIARMQGIQIPGEGPEPLSPEEIEDRGRRREEEERLRSGVDPNPVSPSGISEDARNRGAVINVPRSGTPFDIDIPVIGNVSGELGTTEVDTSNFDVQDFVDLDFFDGKPF